MPEGRYINKELLRFSKGCSRVLIMTCSWWTYPRLGNESCKKIRKNVLRVHTELEILPVIKLLYLLIFLTGITKFLDQRQIFNYSKYILSVLHAPAPQKTMLWARNHLCVNGVCTRKLTHLSPSSRERERDFCFII